MPTPHDLELALQATRDRSSFLKNLLIDALEWPIPDRVESPEGIAYNWSAADLRTAGLDKQLVAGQVWQIQALQANQPWGIFLLEFKNSDAFISGRGLTGPLRKVLRGLVPSRRQHSQLATWKRENLLFICTHQYEHFRFAYFKAPPDNTHAAPLAAFGWGPDMPARTACEFNLRELVWPDTGTSDTDWVSGWASAFDVEKVTKKFYEEYATIFTAVEKAIAAENGLKDGEDLRMFTQTLVNRLMFLRFLERKGWLKFNGSESYLRSLYDAGPFGKKSFYRGRVLPLFFEGLAIDREGEAPAEPHAAFGEVPFLNGGLFEANELDKRIKEVSYAALGGLIGGHGLFYRYNFTVEESTPLDIEVAVDPEMLGKVFEELVTGRHESGSYYTPRPIVSFMCREALKGYLTNKTKASADAIAALVDQATVAGLTEAHGRQILEALDSLKAVDPACGSGAYLLGLLHELVAIYRLLISEKLVKDRRSLYDLKLRIISHNLYGVDIDPFATNIAMLRLWLSLEVEADEPLPLPNLDFKIETGDSLLGPDPAEWPDLYSPQTRTHTGFLVALKENYLTAHGDQRIAYRKQVEALESKIRDEVEGLHGEGVIDWRIQFAEVFVYNKGFDIVLANPPYVRHELIKGLKSSLSELFPAVYTGASDLYVFFYARAIQLLRSGGMLIFISSNKWLRAGYGQSLQAHICDTCGIHSITDFGSLPVFQSAMSYPLIMVAQKGIKDRDGAFTRVDSLDAPYPDILAIIREAGTKLVPNSARPAARFSGDKQSMDSLEKMKKAGIPLGQYVKGGIYFGIKTAFNKAFVLDQETKERLVSANPECSEVIRRLALGKDIRKWSIEERNRWLIVAKIGIPIKRYPAVFAHLSQWQSELKKRKDQGNHWWELRACAYYDVFEQPKIIWGNMSLEPRFAYSSEPLHVLAPANVIPVNDLFLLGLLNSTLGKEFRNSSPTFQFSVGLTTWNSNRSMSGSFLSRMQTRMNEMRFPCLFKSVSTPTDVIAKNGKEQLMNVPQLSMGSDHSRLPTSRCRTRNES